MLMAPRSKKRPTATGDNHDNLLRRLTHIQFKLRDIVQVVIGASLLAVPVGFTEETWRLGSELPMANIVALLFISLGFISIFVFYNYYHHHIKGYRQDWYKRVFSTYVLAFFGCDFVAGHYPESALDD